MAESPKSVDEKDTELTMCDVLEEEKELEEDANAVLGGSDDKNCSYDLGYVPRQALYACKSCNVEGFAGICLACCYACHDGHDVVELYTKRDFRCDCGNSKFTDNKCILNPNKETVNSKNNYNQNFKGLYCTCSRPYPDLEDSVPDQMIQCVVCEDWYHGRHLGVDVPDDYYEMVCGKCMSSHSFLYSYQSKNDSMVDVVGESSDLKFDQDPKELVLVKTEANKVEEESSKNNHDSMVPCCLKSEEVSVKTELSNRPSTGDVSLQPDTKSCLLEKLDKNSTIKREGAVFWPEDWRKSLCRCANCINKYSSSCCEFLLNLDDTIQAYEEKGKRVEGESQYDKGLSALGQLDRVKQMEAIRAYTNMKGQLKEYLKEFADNKRTVQESDIKEFFDRIGKKQKLSNGVPYFCR